MEIVNREKDLFPCFHILNISPHGRDLFWQAFRKILREANIENG